MTVLVHQKSSFIIEYFLSYIVYDKLVVDEHEFGVAIVIIGNNLKAYNVIRMPQRVV